jgi:hypothetical protein
LKKDILSYFYVTETHFFALHDSSERARFADFGARQGGVPVTKPTKPIANNGDSFTTITVTTPLYVAQQQGKKWERLEARVSRPVHGAVLRPSRSNTSRGHDLCRHDHSSSIAGRWAAAGEARRA